MSRSSRRSAPARGPSRAAPAAAAAAPAVPLPPFSHPALAALAVVAAAIGVLLVSTRIDDPDVWQHLIVGKAIWALHAIPRTDLWTWPDYGAPYLLPSWLFRAALWPAWAAGGLTGLYAWRWITTLAAFALLWRAARSAGATGAAPVVMLVWCAMFWRQRSQLRPDTLVAVLLAAEVALLEARRHGRRVHAAWLVPIAWAWVNAHISYLLFFAVGGAYLLDAAWRSRGATAAAPAAGETPRALLVALALCVAVAPLNPFGLATLAQPFDFYLHWRHEPIFTSIFELRPLLWSYDVRNGFAAFLGLAFVLAVLRARRRGPDVAQALLLPLLLYETVTSQRFIGYFALVAAPFAARDLADALARVRWPAWAAAPAARAALASVACVALATPELTRADVPLGLALDPVAYPTVACDWMAAHGVHGRGFNAYSEGGYLLWRFWPDRGRLPFMDIHQTGSRRDRDLYAYAWADAGAWRELDGERRFDWALVLRKHGTAAHLMDWLDADPAWALVFADDAGALYLRRAGADSALAAREAYRWVPAGDAALPAMAQRVATDPAARDSIGAELRRQVAASPLSGQAHSQLANVEAMGRHWQRALDEIRAARAVDPGLPRLDERESLAREALERGAGADGSPR